MTIAGADVLLGIDLGTTRLKVVAFDLEGRALAAEATRNVEHADEDGERRWQDPEEWWADACRLAREVLASEPVAGRAIRGIGFSGRGGGFVPIGTQGRVVAPSWSDNRHAEELRELMEWRRSGAHLSNYAAQPIAKWQWLRAHEPHIEVARMMYAKDWLVYRMTGRVVTDPTSGPDAPDFDRDAIATLGIDPALLPDVDAPWAVAGTVTREAAAALGIAEGTPVAVGGHDGICANLGAGAGEPGAYAITIGTHAVVRAVTTEHPTGAYRFYGMPPGRHVIGGNAIMAGRAADWFLDGWLDSPPEDRRREVFATMDASADSVPPGARGVRFLPFLSGQVAPVARPGASAAFAGLRAHHGRAEMYRAVLEGGAFAIRAIWEQVTGWCGAPRVARFTGTGALSDVWRQMIVDCIDWPCEVVDGYAEARGAAIYAAVATGGYPDVDVAARAMVHPALRVEPDPARVEAYQAIYADWQRVSDVMRALEE